VEPGQGRGEEAKLALLGEEAETGVRKMKQDLFVEHPKRK
jgi:hypothetical protein